MCSNTLAWDALGTLVIYLIGLPVLLSQTASEEVRQVLDREIWRLRWLIIAILLVLIWALTGLVLAFCQYSVFVILLLLIVAIIASLIGVFIVHPRILTFVLGRATFHLWKTNQVLYNQYLEYLEILGSGSGSIKKAVVRELGYLMLRIVDDDNYEGNSLKKAGEIMSTILEQSTKRPSAATIQVAIEVLDKALNKWKEKKEIKSEAIGENDPIVLTRVLAGIGKVALIHYPNMGLVDAVLGTLQRHSWLGPRATQRISEIGGVAIDQHHPEVAMSALRHIEHIIGETGFDGKGREMLYDYAGIVALFCSHCGASGKQFAKGAWTNFCSKREAKEKCADDIQEAYDHHVQSGRFKLADAIQKSKGGSLGLCAD